MIESLLVQLGLWSLCGVGVAIVLLRSQRRTEARWQKLFESFRTFEPKSLVLPNAKLAVSTGLSEEMRAIIQSPSPALEHALAVLNATAESGVTDEDPPSTSPPAPIDLGELAHRLSEAGYAGGPLRLTNVEVRPDQHVVVHLEPQRP